ncbi:MAG: serine hydrolase [Rhodobacteraceae bacterium]|nr:serine hydrolase [Paracoccaceae bacterium]
MGFVDPTYPGAPAPTTGYDYSNTNYALAGMIIEKAAGRSVAQEFADRFFGASYGLTDTYYAAGPYPDAVTDRMAAGYLWEPEITEMKPLLGQDMRLQDMS